MEKRNAEMERLLRERFGKDNVMALATLEGANPCVRYVNAYYEDGAFYVITYARSAKMLQLERNSSCAICGEWFSARTEGKNLGWFRREENRQIAAALRRVFAEWIDNGHNNFDDPDCIILKLRLLSGTLYSHGTRYDIDFTA